MTDYRFQINPARADVAGSNTLLNGRARTYHDPGYRTTLSIKSVIEGEARYETRQSVYRVTPETVVILNRGQEYTLEIGPRGRTETLAVFFQPGFVEEVTDGRGRRTASLLDDPEPRVSEVGFAERLHPKPGELGAVLRSLSARLRGPAPSSEWLEERFYELAASLIGLDESVRREIETFPGLRVATREELYRRLHYARDVLESCFDESLTIEQLARRAYLSPYHFLRTFREAFGRTPMQYLQRKRLQEAKRLLAEGRPVTEVCLAVGFQSLPSFSTLFKKTFGVPPSAYRLQALERSVRVPPPSSGGQVDPPTEPEATEEHGRSNRSPGF